MARAWGVLGDSWRGSQFAYDGRALRARQVVRLATLLGIPANPLRIHWTHIQAAASYARCARRRSLHHVSSAASNVRDKGARQELLLSKTFSQDNARWWDTTYQKWNARSHQESGGALVLDNWCNLAWLHEQTDCSGTASSASPCNLFSVHHADQRSSPGFDRRVTPESVKKLCQQGQVEGAVEGLQALVGMNFGIDKYLLYSVLKECAVQKNLAFGGQVHALARAMGFGSDTFLCNHLIRMYAAHGKLQEALDVFRGVALPDAFMWSSIISAHVKQGQAERAIQLYQNMRAARMKSDGHVLVAALQACAAAGDLQTGKQVHDDVFTSGMEHNMFVCSCLVDMFAKCGSLKDARRVFDRLVEKNVVTWSAMIAGYARVEGMGQEALSLYSAMCNEGMAAPNAVTFACLLQACANVGASALETGKLLHAQLKDQSLQFDVPVASSLVNMYVKCGSLEDARIVFDRLAEKNVVTWTAMIAGYAQQEGMGREALNLFSAMESEGMAAPNAVTFASLLQACANVGMSALDTGKQLHSQLKDRGLESDVVVGGSLVDMYVKCKSLKDARIVFDGLGEKNVVNWNTMIAGYAEEEGMGQEALNIHNRMCSEGITAPNAVTYVCLLEACASVGALHRGKQLHAELREGGFELNELIASCLVKLYAKCGGMEVCRDVFDRLPVKNLVTWNVLLKGYADHGVGGAAIQCFQELLDQGIQPDEVTYICIFTACSHAGLVDEGQQYFKTMTERHRVAPNDRHYNCMVDLFGRSGHLDRAEQLLRASDLAGDAVSWTALLSACKSFGDAETGRRCFDHLVKLDPTVATAYVLLGGIYANAGRWDEVDWVESLRKAAGARKMAAKACIEVKEEVHEFTVGEERSDVAATLRKMSTRVKEGGHVPQTQQVFRGVSEQEKEDALCGHAEKLALAYGVLNTPAGYPLVVTKNLRMCNDCHSSTKIMSLLEKREIVVRDGHKVHRFQNGACSCKDRP